MQTNDRKKNTIICVNEINLYAQHNQPFNNEYISTVKGCKGRKWIKSNHVNYKVSVFVFTLPLPLPHVQTIHQLPLCAWATSRCHLAPGRWFPFPCCNFPAFLFPCRKLDAFIYDAAVLNYMARKDEGCKVRSRSHLEPLPHAHFGPLLKPRFACSGWKTLTDWSVSSLRCHGRRTCEMSVPNEHIRNRQ